MRILFIIVFLFFTKLIFAETFLISNLPQFEYAETQNVLVSALGRDEAEALEQALRLAVERVAGTMLTSETYIKNGDIISENIARYSSSYVKRYKIASLRQEGSYTKITISADVAKKKVAEKLQNLNVSVLEMDDIGNAHDMLLAAADEYRNKVKYIQRQLKRIFGDVHSVIDVSCSNINFRAFEVENTEKVPFDIKIHLDINQKRYEQKTLELEALVKHIGGSVRESFEPVKFKYNQAYNKLDFVEPYARQEHFFFIMRHKKDGSVYDLVSIFDASEELRALIETAFSEFKLVGSIQYSNVHIEFTSESGEILYEDVVPFYMDDAIRDFNPQSALSLLWNAENIKYNRLFPLEHRNFKAGTGGRTYASIERALVFSNLPYKLKEYTRRERIYFFNGFLLAPYFRIALYTDGSLYGINMADKLTLVYKGVLDEALVGNIKNVSVYIKND